MSNINTVRGSAQKTGVDVLAAVGAAAGSVTTTLHMLGDLSAAGRVKSQRLLHDVKVKDIATREAGDELIIQEASRQVASSMIAIEDELGKDARLKKAYDAIYSQISAKVAAL